jgi:hypothetical protein
LKGKYFWKLMRKGVPCPPHPSGPFGPSDPSHTSQYHGQYMVASAQTGEEFER